MSRATAATHPRCVAVIPARGGSKGIPGKNLALVAGKPLVAHAICAAREAALVDRVFVSTDDPLIAQTARRWGAEVVDRPAELSGDLATSEAALLHALDAIATAGERPELLTFLQCTSPLTAAQDIDGTIDALLREQADSALAVTDFHYFLWRPDATHGASGINHDKAVRPMRQQREAQYLETGAVYVMRVDGFRAHKHRFFGKTAMHELPRERVWEIDDPVDLQVVEALLHAAATADLRQRLPQPVDALVMDFDGVHTDNRVTIDDAGHESVRCNRSDGLGIELLRKAGVPMLVLSKERNPVVAARCAKLQLELIQGLDSKVEHLQAWLAKRSLRASHCVYLGNDVNDLECLAAVGGPVIVADAHPAVHSAARIVLRSNGGAGAVRELADLILSNLRGSA